MDRPKRINEICADHGTTQDKLLPILIDIQSEFGCVDGEAERLVASALNLTRAEVHGVVSFYHDFHSEPDPRPEVQICRAEACKARGVEALIESAENAAGDRVRLKSVYCLGLCATGPNARVGDRLHSRLDDAALRQLIERA